MGYHVIVAHARHLRSQWNIHHLGMILNLGFKVTSFLDLQMWYEILATMYVIFRSPMLLVQM